VFVLESEGGHNFFHPMQNTYHVAMCIDGKQGEWGRLFADALNAFHPVELGFFREPGFVELGGQFCSLDKAAASAKYTACFGRFSFIVKGQEE